MSEDATLDEFLQVETEKQSGSEWSESKLEDLLSELLTGGRPTGGGLDEGAYISIGGTQVNSEGYIDLHDLVYIPEDYFEQVEKTQLQKHDILVVKDGANTGDVAIAWESNDRVVTNEHLFTLRSDSSINSPYLFYFLLSHLGWKQINGTITGSAQEGINQGFTGKVDIQYPSLSEQRKISTVLYTVDQGIEKTEEIIDQSDRLLRGLMDDIFQSGVSSADQYQETPVGRFPESWDIVQIQDILTEKPSYGIVKPGDGDDNGVRMIRATDIEHGKIVEEQPIRVSESKAQEYERTKIYENNVLLSVMGTVGRSMCAPKSLEGANVNRALAVLRIDETQVIPKFADFWFRSPHIQSYFETQKFGTAQPRLNLGFLRKMKFPIPSIEEQKEVVDVLGEVENRYWTERKTREQLERLKRGLMQDLLSGTVRTTDTNIEVPEEIAQYG